jgi:undecaprenyl diphosphate synthase
MNNGTNLPRHVAIIPDGNGRWAEQRGKPRLEGHHAGVQNVRHIIKHLKNRGIQYVTLYAFSTENWTRPVEEVSGIFGILERMITSVAEELHTNGVRILHIGRMDGFSKKLQKSIKDSIKLTENNKGMTLVFAFNYGGRTEIVDATRKLILKGESADSLDEKTFSKYLYTAGLPDVDLLIRTGGEMRISNFLIWQAAYAEYYFTNMLWPDFNEVEADKALEAYSQRKRRFGGL